MHQYWKNIIQSNGDIDGGYSQAQLYYEGLRKKMLNDLASALPERPEGTKKLAEDIMNSLIVSGFSSSQTSQADKQRAEEALLKVEKMVTNFLGNNRAQAVSIISSTQAAAKKPAEKYSNYTQSFMERLYTQMEKNVQFKDMFSNNVLKSITAKTSSQQAVLKSYALRYLVQSILGTSDQYFNLSKDAYIQSLKGYYHEVGVQKILKNQILPHLKRGGVSNTNMGRAIINSGDWKVGGKERAEDLLFNFSFGRTEKELKNLWERSYVEDVEVDSKILEPMLTEPFKAIYGAQIKSFNLQSPKASPLLPIGSRSGLLSELLSKKEYQYGYSLIGNIAFLNQKEKILEALGPNNVMFVDGERSYWMSNFINEFRAKKYYLHFRTTAVKQKKNRKVYRATREVALYNYMSAKTHFS